MSIDIDKERAAFEAWAIGSDGPWEPRAIKRRRGSGYRNEELQEQWDCWQAARATPLAPTPAAAEGKAEVTCDQCIELAEELQKEWMRKAIAETRAAASLFDVGGFRAGMETACDEIETRMSLDAAPLPRQAAVQGEDTARLDWLEQAAESLDGLMLHDGRHPAPGRNGLGLRYMGRTLRQAVDSARGIKSTKSATATTEKEKS